MYNKKCGFWFCQFKSDLPCEPYLLDLVGMELLHLLSKKQCVLGRKSLYESQQLLPHPYLEVVFVWFLCQLGRYWKISCGVTAPLYVI